MPDLLDVHMYSYGFVESSFIYIVHMLVPVLANLLDTGKYTVQGKDSMKRSCTRISLSSSLIMQGAFPGK